MMLSRPVIFLDIGSSSSSKTILSPRYNFSNFPKTLWLSSTSIWYSLTLGFSSIKLDITELVSFNICILNWHDPLLVLSLKSLGINFNAFIKYDLSLHKLIEILSSTFVNLWSWWSDSRFEPLIKQILSLEINMLRTMTN